MGPRRRVALWLQYHGALFHGWQRQRNACSVQQCLDETILRLDTSPPSRTVAAGRTDAGVHASGQVVHFDTSSPMAPERWAGALNGALPPTIRILESREVASEWHACFSARYRRYRYLILNSRRPNLFIAAYSWHRYRLRLDERVMERGLKTILGHNDFSAFQRAGSRRTHARITVQDVSLRRHGDLLEVEVQASGFLYGMARLLVGQLVALGEGRLTERAFEKRWRDRRRQDVKEAAPAHGLCLLRVGYPEPIFTPAACFDSLPLFVLAAHDAPPGRAEEMITTSKR